MFTTITARYDTVCKRCNRPIKAGARMRYGGRNRSYHLSAECPANGTTHPPQPTPTTIDGFTDYKMCAANDRAEV